MRTHPRLRALLGFRLRRSFPLVKSQFGRPIGSVAVSNFEAFKGNLKRDGHDEKLEFVGSKVEPPRAGFSDAIYLTAHGECS